MTRHPAVPAARALAFLRIVTGGVWLWAAVGKLTLHPVQGIPVPVVSLVWQRDLPARLAGWLAAHPEGTLAAVVRDLLLPNGPLVAGLVLWAQIVAGVLLVLGLRTTLASLIALAVAGSLAVVAGARGGLEARPYLLLAALALAFLLGRAGETAGLDGWRRERRRDRDL